MKIFKVAVVGGIVVMAAVMAHADAIRIKKFSFPSGFNNASAMTFVKGKERIWIFRRNADSYEFDIESGSWTALGKSVGNCASDPYINLVEDAYAPGWLWSANFYDGLLHYNLINRSSQVYTVRSSFGGHPVTAVALDKNRIWVGTASGLYYLSRDSQTTQKVDAFGNTWVKSLAVDGIRIWVNGSSFVDSTDLQIKEVSVAEKWPMKEVRSFSFLPPYKISFDSYGKTVVIIGSADKIILSLDDVEAIYATRGEGAIWLYWGDIARFDLNSMSIAEKYTHIHGGAKCLYEDGDFLLFLADNYLARINRKTRQMDVSQLFLTTMLQDKSNYWALSSQDGLIMIPKANLNEAFKIDKSLEDAKNRIGELGGFLRHAEDIDIVQRIKYIVELFELLRKDKTNREVNILTSEARHALRMQKEGGDWFAPKLDFAQLTELEKPIGYYALATSAFGAGKPVEAMEYFEILRKSYPDSICLGWIQKNDLELMIATKNKYQEISRKKMSKDQRLWELGNLYFDAMLVDWNTWEVGYNTNLAFSYFNELISKYPDSIWAKTAQQKMDEYNSALEQAD
ncbi:MAG: tetratricopeptide repeat protein [Elusimicrobia bacterium]|nr:tetratricopeptide repeat protein [Elusimicrobiota bacterium]